MDLEPGHVVDPQADHIDASADLSLSANPPLAPAMSAAHVAQPVLSFEQPGEGTNGHPQSLVIEESLDQPPQLATLSQPTALSAEVVSTTPSGGIVGRATSVYAPHMKGLLVAGIASLLVLGSGAWVLIKTAHHTPETPRQSTAAVPVQPASAQELSINSKLKVAQDATLEKSLTVAGTTTLQGVVVKADELVNGNVTVQGNGNFSGNITASNFNGASLTISGNSSFSGNLSVNNVTAGGNITVGGAVSAASFQGSFTGDGSKLTNLAAANCTDCVRLQTGSVTAQVGDVSVAGTLTGRKLHIQPSVDDTQALSIQDANGANVLSIDTVHRQLSVSDLLPTKAGSISTGSYTPGSFTPGRWQSAVTKTIVGSQNSAGADGVAMAKGTDGFARIAYDSYDGTTSSIKFARCTDADCTNPVISTLASGDSYEFLVMEVGPDGFVRIAFENDNLGLQLVICKNQDCTAAITSNVDISNTDAGAYGIGIGITSDNLVRLDYENDVSGNWRTYYAACNDIDCTAPVIQDLDTNEFGYQVVGLAVGSDDMARLVYEDSTNGYFHFVRCTNASCSTPVNTVVNDNSDGNWPGCYADAVRMGNDGLPRLVYQNCGDAAIHFVQCLDADCVSKVNSQMSFGGQEWQTTNMILGNDGFARIFYTNNTDESYMFDRCTTDDCSAYVTTQIESSARAGRTGQPAYIASDGIPRVAYLNYDNNSVYFGRFTNADASTFIPPVTVDPVTVAGGINLGTNVGDSTNRFGQIFAQGLDLQTASTGAALVVNQVGVYTDTSGGVAIVQGPLADFQVNGVSKFSIDNDGSLKVHNTLALQADVGSTLNLQEWKASDGTVVSSVDSEGNIVSSGNIASTGKVIIGTSPSDLTTAGQLVVTASALQTNAALDVHADTGNFLTISAQGNTTIGNQSLCLAGFNNCAAGTIITSVPMGSATVSTSLAQDDKGNLYVASDGGKYSMQIFSLSKPTSPTLLASVTSLSIPEHIEVAGHYAYLAVTDPYNALEIYDISNPVLPQLISRTTPNPDFDVFDVKIVGNTAYLLGRSALQAYDISNPAAPAYKGNVAVGSQQSGNYTLFIDGSTAYVYNGNFGTAGLYAVDISNPASMRVTSSVLLSYNVYGGGAKAVKVGQYVYVTTANGLYIVDVSDPSFLRAVAGPLSLVGSGYGSSIKLLDGKLYMQDQGGGMGVYSLTDPINPQQLESSTSSAGIRTTDFLWIGNYLYVPDISSDTIKVLTKSTHTSAQDIEALALTTSYDTTINGQLNVNSGGNLNGTFNLNGQIQFASGLSLANGTTLALQGSNGASYLSANPSTSSLSVGGSVNLLSPWAETTSLVNDRLYGEATAGSNGYVYLAGGQDYDPNLGFIGYTTDVLFAKVNSDGSLGSWTINPNPLPNGFNGAALVANGAYIYEIAGFNATANADTATIRYATLNSDGTTGSWSTTTPLPYAGYARAVSYNGYMIVRGNNGQIYKAVINANGTLGVWSSIGSFSTFTPRNAHVYNGYLYYLDGSYLSYAKLNADGTLASGFTNSYGPLGWQGGASVLVNGTIVVAGGYDGYSQRSDKVQIAQLGSNGAPVWAYGADFATGSMWQAATSFNGYMYIIGGFNTSNFSNKAYVAQLTSGQPLTNIYLKTSTVITPTSNNITTFQVQNASSTVIFNVDTTNGRIGINTATPSATLHVIAATAGTVGQVIQGAAAQTADLVDLQDSSSALMAKFDANANFTAYGTNMSLMNLATPTFGANTSATTGGSLTTPNTYYYVITATNAQGQTIASSNASFTPTTTTSTYTLKWAKVNGATGYKIYRNTSNSFTTGNLLLTAISNGTTITYTDTGSATAAGLPPTTSAGTGLILKAWQGQTGALLQAQDSTGTVLASVTSTGNLTAKSATFSGTLTLNGHIISGNASGSITATVQLAAGTTATCTVTGNDTAGTVVITVNGTGIATGNQCKITFGTAFGAVPHPVISPIDTNSQARGVYIGSTTTDMTFGFSSAGTAGTVYSYNYFNIQ